MKNWLIIIVLCIPFHLFAQQEAQFSQYMFDNLSFNPGYAGSQQGICASLLVREQWMGFKDDDGNKVAPQTFLISVHSPVRILRGGVGGSLYQDKLGFESTIGLKLGYAYQLSLGEGNMAIGAQIGFLNKTIDFDKLTPKHEDDPVIKGKSKESDMILDGSLGLYYHIPGKFYLGFSVPEIGQSKGSKTGFKNRRHYFLTAGYKFPVPGYPAFELSPSLLMKSDFNSFQAELDALVIYNNKIWGGLGYRYQDAVIALVGMNFKDFRVGVSYDIGVSSIRKYHSGSLEIMAGYCFKIETDKGKRGYRNTRFL
ncbi:MAG: type IX secretion system membrane protein PorP/SprF [Bacteroidetes bacterium]|nr:type IX secretion system membrane protein PorP/SprF [Bacteroidota bacterium]